MRNKPLRLMLACCSIALAALAAVVLFGVSANSVVVFGVILLCPALHFLMMCGMMGGHHHGHYTPDAKPYDISGPASHHQPAGRSGV